VPDLGIAALDLSGQVLADLDDRDGDLDVANLVILLLEEGFEFCAVLVQRNIGGSDDGAPCVGGVLYCYA
jgi:hypothetical protein